MISTSGSVQRLRLMLPCCSCLQWGQRQASSGASWKRGWRRSEAQPFPGPARPFLQARPSERSGAERSRGQVRRQRAAPAPSCSPALFLPALQRRWGALWSHKHVLLLQATPSYFIQAAKQRLFPTANQIKLRRGWDYTRKLWGAGTARPNFKRREPRPSLQPGEGGKGPARPLTCSSLV